MKQRNISAQMISRMSKQSLKASRMRNIFVTITIALASALLMAILMFAFGQAQQISNELSHRQQVSYYNLTDEQAETLKKDGRIAYQIQVKTGILSELDGFDIMPYYVSELSDQIRIAELESGRLPETGQEVAAQAALFETMGVTPAPGGSVTFSFYDGSTETFTISGILKGGGAAKQFSVFFSEDYANTGSQLKDMPYEVHARLYDADSMSAAACQELMFQIGSDADIARKYTLPSRAFLSSRSIDTQSVLLYGTVGTVILLACVLVIYGVFYLSVIGRIHQFGQLRTIGMTRKQMKKFVSREGSLLFLCSAPVGILIGAIAGYGMVPDGFNILNTLRNLVLVFVVIYCITMLSVRKPARLAASVSPMEALRYVPQETMKQSNCKTMCRKLTPFGLGRMNFSKNRKKTAVTLLSLALGGILFMTAATYLSSFSKEKYPRQGYFTDAEFHITYSAAAIELDENGMSGLQAKSPLGKELTGRIASIDGVKKVTEIKSFGVKYDYPSQDEYNDNDMVYPLTEEELKELDAYVEEGSADVKKLMSGDYILAADNDTVEEVFGWRFAAGETVTLHYFDGVQTAEKDVTILGILSEQYTIDHNELEGWFLMPEQAVLPMLSHDSLNKSLLVSTDAEKEEAVGAALAELVAETTELTMETLAERRIVYEQSANQIFGAVSGLSVFIMMFSILSMMNTLITNIVTRKQELAMLASIGMGKNQIRSMLLFESMILVVVTIGSTMTAGTICGYALNNSLYKNGAFYMAFQFPTAFALAYAGVLILVPLLITLVSMQSFSKEPLVTRLRGAEN